MPYSERSAWHNQDHRWSKYKQIELHQGIPFPVKLPNAETQKTLNDSIAGKNMNTFSTLDELYHDLEI